MKENLFKHTVCVSYFCFCTISEQNIWCPHEENQERINGFISKLKIYENSLYWSLNKIKCEDSKK